MTYSNATSGATTWSYSGIVLDTKDGELPAKTPKELLATRAVESKDGWLGQIIMSGEIVHQTEPQETSGEALEEVNSHIHKRFKKLITGG